LNGDNNVEIEHYKVINGGHGWPGVLGNMDINSNFIIWNFVSQFDINGKI
jgi:polyhydroxybutyrate depolymerase